MDKIVIGHEPRLDERVFATYTVDLSTIDGEHNLSLILPNNSNIIGTEVIGTVFSAYLTLMLEVPVDITEYQRCEISYTEEGFAVPRTGQSIGFFRDYALHIHQVGELIKNDQS